MVCDRRRLHVAFHHVRVNAHYAYCAPCHLFPRGTSAVVFPAAAVVVVVFNDNQLPIELLGATFVLKRT